MQSSAEFDCGWVHDSTSSGRLALDSHDLEDVRRRLEDCGDYSAAGRAGAGLAAFTDCAGSRPLFLSATGGGAGGSVVLSNRRKRFRSLKGVQVVPGDTALDFSSKEVKLKRLGRHAPKVRTGELLSLLENSLKKRLVDWRRVAVAFSGGLDSTLLALLASKVSSVVLVTVYVAGYGDRAGPAKVASSLGLEQIEVEVGPEEAASQVKEWSAEGLWTSPMDYSLAVGFRAASVAAKRERCELLLAGQGADELFGGYSKYQKLAGDSGAMKEVMEYDIRNIHYGVARDVEAIREGGCEPCFPYLDRAVVEYARAVPPRELIVEGVRKVPLRKVAMEVGVSEEVAMAPKKAFQYGSGLQKLIDKVVQRWRHCNR